MTLWPVRRLVIVLAAVVVLIAATCIRIQPPGSARVIRRGVRVAVVSQRVAFVLPAGTGCLVPMRGDRLLFQSGVRNSELDLNVNFAYDAPLALPRGWPDGDWCQSLTKFVERNIPAISEVADPREVEWHVSNEVQRALGAAQIKASSVSARLQLPRGWERTRPIPEIAKLARPSWPVIFIGLDGADWQLLDDYIARGTMPNLARLVREGTSGVLETEHPPLSPLVWTTMMTGVSPLEHHILDFTHFNASTGVKEPITSDERAAPAIWNMATMAGKRVAVFGLWATYPAEPVRGLMVSDRLLYSGLRPRASDLALTYPPSRDAWARAVKKAAEHSIDDAMLRRFLPLDDQRAGTLRGILTETEVIRRLATDTLASSSPDLTVAYFQGTDEIGHVFAPLIDDARYHAVPELYFRRVDEILGDFIGAAERNRAVVMIASDHGFRWKEGRPAISSVATATAAKWHRNEGIYLLWGHGVAPSGGHRSRGGIRQICSRLMDACGLPHVDYRRWFVAFSSPAPAPSSSNEEIAKLRALGYIGSNESSSRPPGLSSTVTAGAYNNAGLILKEENRTREAIESFRQALKVDPNLASAAWNLSDLLFTRNESLDEADDLLVRALQNGLPDATKSLIERSIVYQRSGRGNRSLHLLEGAVASHGDDPELRMFRGRYRVEQRNCSGALEDFRAAEQLRPKDAMAFASAGLAEMCLGNRDEAQASFRRSLELDPNQPMLRRYLQQ